MDLLLQDLPDEIMLSVFARLSATVLSPRDLLNLRFMFNNLAVNPTVLSVASQKCLRIRADKWCDQAHQFLRLCVTAGNVEASYILGMIEFYALGSYHTGAALLAQAAMRRHAAALYSLAVIKFNGSGGVLLDRDVPTGFALCFRAAACGSLDALRQLGYCVTDGYGVGRSIPLGTKLLEMVDSLKPIEDNVHVVNQFLREWFTPLMDTLRENGLAQCRNYRCGRVETRIQEFHQCSRCVAVSYCTKSCMVLDWEDEHKALCGVNFW